MPTITARFAALALPLALWAAAPAWARDGHDHDLARQAVQSGEILPLKAILERVERSNPGQVMEVEIERKNGRWIYELKILRAGGTLSKLKVDARDGSLIDRKAIEPPPAKPSSARSPAGAQP